MSATSTIAPNEFARLLTQKLDAIRRQHDAEEQLNARLESADHPKLLAEVIKEKLSCDDADCDQAILDQHVSRVWADRTPCRSPGRPKSPEIRRKGTNYQKCVSVFFIAFGLVCF